MQRISLRGVYRGIRGEHATLTVADFERLHEKAEFVLSPIWCATRAAAVVDIAVHIIAQHGLALCETVTIADTASPLCVFFICCFFFCLSGYSIYAPLIGGLGNKRPSVRTYAGSGS